MIVKNYFRITKNKELYTMLVQQLNFESKHRDLEILEKYFPNVYEIFAYQNQDNLIFRVIADKEVYIEDKSFTLITEENFYYLISNTTKSKENHYRFIDNLPDLIREERQNKKYKLLNELNCIPQDFKERINNLQIEVSTTIDKTPIEIRKTNNTNNRCYGIYKGNNVYSKIDEKFYYEPLPSNRDEEFFNKFRYNSIEEAIINYYK